MEASYALSNLYALDRSIFSDSLLAQLATQLLSPLDSSEAATQQGALMLLRQISLHAGGRRALNAAKATPALRGVMERMKAADASSARQLELIIGMMSVAEQDPPVAPPLSFQESPAPQLHYAPPQPPPPPSYSPQPQPSSHPLLQRQPSSNASAPAYPAHTPHTQTVAPPPPPQYAPPPSYNPPPELHQP
ncbi:MAG: hypothetical protein SGPRY_004508, partial [Prymnesium sp.]